MGTILKFVTATGTARPEVFDDTVIFGRTRATSAIRAETGFSHHFELDAVATTGHMLSMNLDRESLPMEVREGRTFQRRYIPRNTLYVQRGGEPMYVRNGDAVRFCAIELPTEWADAVCGAPLALRSQCGLADEHLARLIHLLDAELVDGCPTGDLYVDALATALTARLGRVLGVALDDRHPLCGDRLRCVREHVEEHLTERLTVHRLATLVGLSVAHFGREFKRATGMSPHVYVMQRRLERARQLLRMGRTISEAALSTGFADQAHLSRLFRRHFGLTPGAYRRSSR